MTETDTFEIFSRELRRVHWTMVTRSIILIVAGLLIVIWPGISIGVIAVLLGVVLFVNGVLNIAAAVAGRKMGGHASLLIGGIAEVVLALAALVYPQTSAALLIRVFGILFIMFGCFEAGVVLFGRLLFSRWFSWGLLFAVFTIVFGIIVVTNPLQSVRSIALVVGLYAVLAGLSTLIHVSSVHKKIKHAASGKR